MQTANQETSNYMRGITDNFGKPTAGMYSLFIDLGAKASLC